MTRKEMDDVIATAAEKEAEAQLDIVRALKKLRTSDNRQRVMNAVWHILHAEASVPGVLDAVIKMRAK